jgi:hypothetical protein
MGNFTHFHRNLIKILGVLFVSQSLTGFSDDADPLDYAPFEFDNPAPSLTAPPKDSSPKLFGEKLDYGRDKDKLNEIKEVSPEGQTRTYYFPHIAGKNISEHTLSMGPAFSSNPSLFKSVQASWAWLIETKHLIVPRFGALDPAKWGLIFGSRWDLPQRGKELNVNLRMKIPTEIMFGDHFQLRALGIVEIDRRSRWDLLPDLPFLESQTVYAKMASQIYLQYRMTDWFELRVGTPVAIRLPVSTPRGFDGVSIPHGSGYIEYGPGVFLNFPFSRSARFKMGGAYLLRNYTGFPLISQGPIDTSTDLSQTYYRLLGRLDIHTDDSVNVTLLGRYHIFDGSLAAYDFSVPEISVAAQWRVGQVWINPRLGYWARSYPFLTYPTDPDTSGTFAGFTNTSKQESLVSWSIQTVYEIEFQNFESLYLSAALQSQFFSNSYDETAPNAFETLANGTAFDFVLGFGFFL